MFDVQRVELDWGGRKLTLETGKVARQADGAVMASYGETTVLATVVAAKAPKHGIDFLDAQALWNDPDRLEIPARSSDEPRIQMIGRIRGSVWSAFVTRRGDRIRIISVRRARDEEKAA